MERSNSQKKEPKLKEISNLRELVYQTRNNAENIAKEFDFDHYEKEYIQRIFWPIITLNEIDLDSIIAKTISFKEEFINKYKEFDIDIFKRNELDYFKYEIEIYLSSIERGKYNLWDIKKGNFFYHLKLDSEIDTPRHQTLLITSKDEIELELYLKKITTFIKSFIEEHKTNSKKDEVKIKPKETLSEQITHIDKIEITKEIIIKYGNFKGFKLRILLEALKELGLFPKGNTDALFHRCCLNDFKNAGRYQSMEFDTFKKGQQTPRGKYIKTNHEEIFDEIIIFLQSITNK